MNFSERPPSEKWSALIYRGETFAEVWFKPEDAPFALTFRIPQSSFQISGMGQRLTIENLLKAVGVAAEEVESWRYEDGTASGMDGADAELGQPLSPPAQDVTELKLHVRLKQPLPTVAANEIGESETTEEKWQYLEGRWNAIRGLEVSMDTLRLSLEGLRSEMEAASRKALGIEVKTNALSSDMVQWQRAKSRVHHAAPKVKEFIHRFTWAAATSERKHIEELFENHIRPRVAFPQIDQAMLQFDSMLKDRQVLSASGVSVFQECKSILATIQSALRTLEINAAANASKKRTTSRARDRNL